MGKPENILTAVTFALGDERPDHWLGVSIRRDGIEVEYLDATGLEEHAPMDWTPDEATQLLREHGYEVADEWIDIDETGGEDPAWKALIAVSEVVIERIGDAVTVQGSPHQAVELLRAIECDDDCPTCLHGE